MKVVHIHEEYPEHDWARNKDGSIDEFATENGYHNGPLCRRCYYAFCEHCVNDFDEALKEDLPCVIDEYKCPNCNKTLLKTLLKNQKFCDECGTKLDWED